MENRLLGFVLKNAHEFGGKINPKAVLGLVLRDNPELKKDVPGTLKKIEEAVAVVSEMSSDEILEKLVQDFPSLLEAKKEEVKGPLKALRNAEKGKVVVRIAPSPSGALHVGHAYGASLNYEYAKMYEGKFLLRIEDTNPENIYEKGYELIERDAQWLAEGKVAEVVVQSSRLEWYYELAKKLVEMGKAYLCECDADLWREMKNKGEACSCRSLGVDEHLARYEKMFSSYAPGEAVLRLKTDIEHKNPAMRDFSLMRINDHVHPKTGTSFRVWPLMVFSVAVDDHDLGVTHVLNGKDHADNAKKEAMIMDCFGWKVPEYQHWGRINFEGFALSSSKTKLAIEQQEYQGWDDIRLPFMPALRRRGYQAGAFRKFAMKIGLSLNDKTVSKEEFWKMVNAFNKELVEPLANRYFFVDDPVEITIAKAPAEKVSLAVHPDFADRGVRELAAEGVFLVSEKDREGLVEGKLHRLIDYGNFEFVNGKFVFHSKEYEKFKDADNKGKIIHWLPAQESNVAVEVVLEDGKVARGFAEEGLRQVEEGAVVQFEREFFCRVDTKEKGKIIMWYLHT